MNIAPLLGQLAGFNKAEKLAFVIAVTFQRCNLPTDQMKALRGGRIGIVKVLKEDERSSPLAWSCLNVSAWPTFGASERWFPRPGVDSPKHCAISWCC